MVTENKRVGLAILSVALLTVMAGAAISPAIANIAKAFPSASPGLIKLVLTLPSLMVFYSVPVNLSFFIEKNGMGSAASSGMAFAMMTGSAFLMGIYFHRIKFALKHFAIAAAISAMAGGFGILYLSNGIVPVFFGVALIGLGQGFLMPFILHSVRTSVDAAQSVSAMAIVSSMMFPWTIFFPDYH